VSHDRFFLEHVTNRTMELSGAYPEGFLAVSGSYSELLVKRDTLLAAQQQTQHALEGKVKREIEWLRRGAPARTTKAQARIQQAERLIDELADVKQRNTQDRTAGIDFTATQRRSTELLVAQEIGKSLGGRGLFSGLSLTLSPGVRLGVLGPNGSGKTTLLRLLAGELPADSGRIRRATELRAVLFDQYRSPLDPQVSLRRTLSPNGDHVLFQGRSQHVAGWAKRFLFRSEQLDMPIGTLSGGEQARVLIANLMVRPADLLILDEPTNDLDIPTMEVLEECLVEFVGAVALVTHDRFLLDAVCTDLLALDGAGAHAWFADVSQWQRAQEASASRAAAIPSGAKRAVETKPPDRKGEARPVSVPGRRMTNQELREFNGMEDRILAAEEQTARIQAQLDDPTVNSDAFKLQDCWQRLQSAKDEVTRLYARWQELEEIRSNQRRDRPA
jgi:ATP-binding cassette subfamily F protein uup